MCDCQKKIELLLKDSKSNQAIAIRLLAMMLDNKISEIERQNAANHAKQMNAIGKISDDISSFKAHTDKRFKGLEVVSFFSEHRKLFWFVVSCIIFLSGAGVENIYKFLSNIL